MFKELKLHTRAMEDETTVVPVTGDELDVIADDQVEVVGAPVDAIDEVEGQIDQIDEVVAAGESLGWSPALIRVVNSGNALSQHYAAIPAVESLQASSTIDGQAVKTSLESIRARLVVAKEDLVDKLLLGGMFASLIAAYVALFAAALPIAIAATGIAVATLIGAAAKGTVQAPTYASIKKVLPLVNGVFEDMIKIIKIPVASEEDLNRLKAELKTNAGKYADFGLTFNDATGKVSIEENVLDAETKTANFKELGFTDSSSSEMAKAISTTNGTFKGKREALKQESKKAAADVKLAMGKDKETGKWARDGLALKTRYIAKLGKAHLRVLRNLKWVLGQIQNMAEGQGEGHQARVLNRDAENA